MQWNDFFLLCLIAGFLFSVLSVLSGALHIPHVHLHYHGHTHGSHGQAGPLNPATVAAFLLWFGASGYLLTRFENWRSLAVLAAAILCGVAGASIVFLFLARVLLAADQPLNAADYDMTGVLGKLTCNVRPDGTGEMIFQQAGRRCGIPVRSDSGETLERGTDVIVMRYESGIAYVRSWRAMQGKY